APAHCIGAAEALDDLRRHGHPALDGRQAEQLAVARCALRLPDREAGEAPGCVQRESLSLVGVALRGRRALPHGLAPRRFWPRRLGHRSRLESARPDAGEGLAVTWRHFTREEFAC